MLNFLVKNQLSTLATRFVKDLSPKVTVSNLDFGPILLTEKSGFPSYSDISICFRAGVRDEKPTERGSIFNLKQYLYHTYDNDFLENYESVLRTGCLLDVNQDQELTYFKCSFIQEDFDQQLDTLLKLVLSPKQISEEHRQQFIQEGNRKIDIPFDELILKAAYRGQQMGNCQTQGQYEIPSFQDFMNFQKTLLTPYNMVIGYAGILEHDYIAKILNEKFQKYNEFLYQRKPRETAKAYFTHGTYREETDQEELNVAIIFQGMPWSHPKMAVLQVLNSILGNASSWSSGGPGKGMRSRATINS